MNEQTIACCFIVSRKGALLTSSRDPEAVSIATVKAIQLGLNPTDDTENWEAGNELGQELKDEGEKKEVEYEILFKESTTPLFMSGSPEGNKGNAQDEKDETEE